MTKTEDFWFWFGVSLREDGVGSSDIEKIRVGLVAVLARTHFAAWELEEVSWGYLHPQNPYLPFIQELVERVWSEQFKSYEGDPFKYQRYDQD